MPNKADWQSLANHTAMVYALFGPGTYITVWDKGDKRIFIDQGFESELKVVYYSEGNETKPPKTLDTHGSKLVGMGEQQRRLLEHVINEIDTAWAHLKRTDIDQTRANQAMPKPRIPQVFTRFQEEQDRS